MGRGLKVEDPIALFNKLKSHCGWRGDLGWFTKNLWGDAKEPGFCPEVTGEPSRDEAWKGFGLEEDLVEGSE